MNALFNQSVKATEQFAYSEFESNFLNLRIFRNTSTEIPDSAEMQAFCLREKVDLLRLKVDIKHEDRISHVLFATGFPFFYSHSIITLFSEFNPEEIPSFHNKNLGYRKYSGISDKQSFHRIIMEGVKDDPIGYYKTPLLNRLITKEMEAECFTQYFVELYDGRHQDKTAYFVSKNGEDAGIYVYDFVDTETINSPMAAILPEHRNAGVFHDMRVFHLNFCKENGIKKTYLGFRINNFNMPNKLMKNGFSIIRSEHVFHIPTLFSLKSND